MKHMMDYEKADGCDYCSLDTLGTKASFVQTGWKCPRCDIIIAPFMPVCPYCQKKQNVVTNNKTVLMEKDKND